MTIEDFNLAKPIIFKLERLESALLDVISIIDKTNNNINEQYHCSISKYCDGNGWRVDLSGCDVAVKILMSTKLIIEEEIRDFTNQLNNIGTNVREFNPKNEIK